MERERGGGRGEGEEERGEPSRVAEGGGRRKSKEVLSLVRQMLSCCTEELVRASDNIINWVR